MKIIAKVGTMSSELIEVDGRTMRGEIKPHKKIRIKLKSWGKWENAVIDKIYSENEYKKYPLYFISLM